ncbi:CapA family protein [Dysgonomonadaceae bacterium zrk40]|nr:CapA family protein [Dysgonomonadaceae bacterium zrk40]
MRILIAGDFFIDERFQNNKLINKSVKDLFDEVDFRIINLEAPITPNNPHHKITKTGPHLRMSSNTVFPYLHQLKIDALTMANNHILDYGAKGITDTFSELIQQNIRYVGAGNNLTEARKNLSIEKDGLKIAIINFCESEWSIAEEDSPGANPMDIIDNTNQIREAKSSHDKVIVIVHGGHEYYNLPSPRMQKQYRFYAEQGADIIVGHHTHCISGHEMFKGVPIIYSLGNFLFTLPSTKKEWYTGLLIQLEIEKSKPISFKLYHVNQDDNNFCVSMSEGNEIDKMLRSISEFNDIIQENHKLHECWKTFLEQYSDQYLNSCSPAVAVGNNIVRRVFNKLGISRMLVTKSFNKNILNLMRCESHLDAMRIILRNKLK